MKNIEEFLLTSNVTVGQLREWMKLKNEPAKKEIIDLIYHRFYERYIKHVKDVKSGFLKMAVSSLMIETLESFKQGIGDTTGKGKTIFKLFFESEKVNFPKFEELSDEFYGSIRCGILHQAETTKGWRVLLKGDLLDINERAINAELFMESLEKSLDNYIADLGSKNMDDPIWIHALFKLEDICKNCSVPK